MKQYFIALIKRNWLPGEENEVSANSFTCNKSKLQKQKIINQFNQPVFHFCLDYLDTQFK